MTAQTQQKGNPILKKDIHSIRDWQEWKQRWVETAQAEYLHSLLHFGFEAQTANFEEQTDRILFYLDLADGHASPSVRFRKPGDDEKVRPTVFGGNVNDFASIRKATAEKAFQVLCQNLFKKGAGEDSWRPTWAVLGVDRLSMNRSNLDMNRSTLNRLLWFFRPTDEGRLFNTGRKNHHDDVADEFLLNLCTLIWERDELSQYANSTLMNVVEMLREFRHQTIEPLFGLRRLDVLLRHDFEVDEACLQVLEKLALGFEIRFSDGHRKPKTIEEACLGNSQAAQVLLILRTQQKERDRFDKISDAEREHQEAGRRLDELKDSQE